MQNGALGTGKFQNWKATGLRRRMRPGCKHVCVAAPLRGALSQDLAGTASDAGQPVIPSVGPWRVAHSCAVLQGRMKFLRLVRDGADVPAAADRARPPKKKCKKKLDILYALI